MLLISTIHFDLISEVGFVTPYFPTFTHNLRGSGVLPKGQHSWNISLTKEARVNPKVDLESSVEWPFLGKIIYHDKNRGNNQTYSKLILQALLLVTN